MLGENIDNCVLAEKKNEDLISRFWNKLTNLNGKKMLIIFILKKKGF